MKKTLKTDPPVLSQDIKLALERGIMTISYRIQRSIETQIAAKQLGISKPKMARIVQAVEKEYPHHSVDMMTEELKHLGNIVMKAYTSEEIASALIDFWQEIY
jgi:hypothetical protein